MSPYPIGKLQLQAKAQPGVTRQEKDHDTPPFSACLAGLVLHIQGTPVQEGPRLGSPENPAAPPEGETGVGPGPVGQVADLIAGVAGDLWSAAGEGTNRAAGGATGAALTVRLVEAQVDEWSGGPKPTVTPEGAAAPPTPEPPPVIAGGRNQAEPVLPVGAQGQGGGTAPSGPRTPGLAAAGDKGAAVLALAGGPHGHEQAEGGVRTYQVPEAHEAPAAAGGTRSSGPSPAAGSGSVPVRADGVRHLQEDGAPVRYSVVSAKIGEKPGMGEGRGPAVNLEANEGFHVGGSVSPRVTGTAAGSAPPAEKPAFPSKPAEVNATELAARITSLTREGRTQRQELELQLKPPGLGKMRLYTVLVDNRLSVHMVVETPEAGRVLQLSLPELRQALQGQGLSLDQVQVQVNGGYSGDREGPAGREGWPGPGSREWRWYAGGEQEDIPPPPWDVPYRLDYLA
ncbi:MAG: flagellar hook-length control protein FliK [Thermoanaerobacteraceae bacterium]|nr:flagellar hook-length control protein FliK [Thermoanaerobacteraceae bacterium]